MDEPLLQACRQGEAWAIEDLVRRDQAAIHRLCYSILDDPLDAEDATQETFIAAIKALSGFRGQSAFSTWLYSIAVNTCRQHLKRRARRRALDSVLQTSPLHTDTTSPDAERTVMQNEADALLWNAVCDLDEKHRLPIVLRYYHDLPVVEIAQVLEISEGTAHSRLSNARERLRGIIKRQGTAPQKKGALP